MVGQFYVRFQKEDVIDARMREDFIKNRIPNAPPLTAGEQVTIAKLMGTVEEMKVKRVAGTVNDSVEKFSHRDNEGGTAWGMSVANFDVDAVTLFTELWLLNTYAKRVANKKVAIREVWENVDGTRGVEYIGTFRLQGFQDRIFHTWLTWKRLIGEDGRKTFIIAFESFNMYEGETFHDVVGTEKMQEAVTRGIHIIKETTENTCEWTKVQQVDLKLSVLPEYLIDFLVKQQLGKANEEQEKVRSGERSELRSEATS